MKDFFRFENHKKTLMVFFIGLFGTLTPLIFGGVLSAGFGKWPGIAHFWEKGDFYIYSAAFGTQAFGYFVLMLLEKEQKVSKYLLVALTVFSIFIIVFASLLYSSVFTSELMNADSLVAPFLAGSSVVLLLISVVCFYTASYLEDVSVDIKKIDDAAAQEMVGKI